MSTNARVNKGREVLEGLAAEEFTPSKPITDPALFSGRQEIIESLKGFSGVIGRNFVIYGERGVGKTSFCNILFWGRKVYTHNCSKRDDFVTIFLNILSRMGGQFTADERKFLGEAGYSIGTDKVWSHHSQVGTELSYRSVAEQRLDLGFLINKFRKLEKKIDVIVLDEFQNITNSDIQTDIIEAVKGIADNSIDTQIAIVGVASSDEGLLTSTEYAQYKLRHFIAVEIPRMNINEVKDIIRKRKDTFNFNQDEVDWIAYLSCGFPSFAHSFALFSIHSWINRNIVKLAGSLLFFLASMIVPFFIFFELLDGILRGMLLRGAVRHIDIFIINLDLMEAVSRVIGQFNANYKQETNRIINILATSNDQRVFKILILLSRQPSSNCELSFIAEELGIGLDEVRSLIHQQLSILVKEVERDYYSLTIQQLGTYICCWHYLKEIHEEKYNELLQRLALNQSPRSLRQS